MGNFQFYRKTSLFAILIAGISSLTFATEINSQGEVNIMPALTANIYQHIDFGTIAPHLTQTGTVKVNRHTDGSSVCSASLTCIVNGNRARMLVSGMPNQAFTTSNPGQVTLVNGNGASMIIDSWVGGGSNNNTSWGPSGTLNSNGIRRQGFGAILHVGANQPPGTYTGSYSVNVEYQ